MSDALEQAVIAMVLTGDALASQKAKQVTADLTSVERAGRSAEGAAKEASSSVKDLGEQVREVTHKLHLAVAVAERLYSAASGGQKSPELEGLSTGVSTAIGVGRLLAGTPLAPLAVPAAIAAGLFTGISKYEESSAEQDRKADEHAEKIAKKIAEEQRKIRQNDIAEQLMDQAARSWADNVLGSRTVR